MDNCIFCKIIRGEIPSQKVFENEKYFACLLYTSRMDYQRVIAVMKTLKYAMNELLSGE